MPINLLEKKSEGQPVNLLEKSRPNPSNDQIGPAPEPGVFDKVKGFFRDSKKEIADAQNIYALSEATGLPMPEVRDNYEWLRRSTEVTGMTPQLTNQEYTGIVLTPMIMAGMVAHPIGTAAALIGFGALNEIIPTEKWLNDFEKSHDFKIREDVRTTIELADLIGKGALIGGISRKGPQVIENFTKQKIIEYKLPRKVKLTKEQVFDIFQTKELTTAEQRDLFAGLGLTGKQMKQAVSKGIEIEVPAEKITRISDKPFWGKIKQMFMSTAQDQVIVDRAGKPTEKPSGLITHEKTKPYWQRTKEELLAPEPPLKSPEIAPVATRETLKNSFTETKSVIQSSYDKNKTMLQMPSTTEGEKQEILQSISRRVYAELEKNPSFNPTAETEGQMQELLGSVLSEGKVPEEALRNMLESSITSPQPGLQETPKVPLDVPGVPSTSPQVATSGVVGDKGIINTPDQTNFTTRREITSQMPFTLLGNKAEVISRLTPKLKGALTKGIKKVYDLWGGAKGYRIGMFSKIPSKDYHMNEFSDERSGYYKNVQDPKNHKIVISHVNELKDGLITEIAQAFDIDPAKYKPEVLKKKMNEWLAEGVSRTRYKYVREVIQEYGDNILAEAVQDNFQSPESAGKYYFLENTSIFGLSTGPKGRVWTQGLIRTTKGKSGIKEAIQRLENAPEIIGAEHARDKDIPLTQDDAWRQMDLLTENIKAGKVNPKETAVMVDPQYLNPTEAEGTYSVGRSDTTWEGHKQNLENHLLPLIETGAKVIYTNNADPNLLAWLSEKGIPYNIEKGIGAVATRGGRDEVIATPNYQISEWYSRGDLGDTGGKQAGGEIFTKSKSYQEWLAKLETTEGISGAGKSLVGSVRKAAEEKSLSITTMSKLKKFLSIDNLKTASTGQLKKLESFIKDLEPGDTFISPKQNEALNEIVGELPVSEITPKRVVIDQFGDKKDILGEGLRGKLANELMPTVDIKEGHPAVAKVVNNANSMMISAEKEVHRRDESFDKMLTKAEKSRKLTFKGKLKSKIVRTNEPIFAALSGAKVELTKEEVAVVAYLKNFFKKVRDDLGLEKYRKNYVTHMEKDLSEKIITKGMIPAIKEMFQPAKGTDIPTNLMLELDNIIGSEKFFKFALERKGGIDPTTNLRKILHTYSNLYETKKALDAVLPEGQAVTQLLLKGQSAMWMKRFLQNLKGRGLDQQFRTGKMAWLSKITDAIIDIGYLKLLGLNYKSAAKNIIAGETNTWIFQDFPKYLNGKKRFAMNPKKAVRLASEYGILDGMFYEYTQKGIGRLKKAQDMAMIMQKAGEYEIRASLFAGELTEAEWKSGKISKERVQGMSDLVAVTQGKFNKSESPLFLQTWYGRMLMQMNRWRITNAMMLNRIARGAYKEYRDGNYTGPMGRKLGKAFLAYGVGMYIANEFAKAGNTAAERIARSMAEAINNTVEIMTLEPIVKSISNNPTISVLKEISFSIQDLANSIAPALFEEPRKLEFNRGIQDTHITPFKTAEELADLLEQ